MRKQLLIAGAITAAILGGSGVAYATVSSPAATQPVNAGVYACVNTKGGIDYLEFNAPIPHPCWFPGETLWQLNSSNRVITPRPTPTATRTVTVTSDSEQFTDQSNTDTTFTLNVPAGHIQYGSVTATATGPTALSPPVTVDVTNVDYHTNVATVSYSGAFTDYTITFRYNYES